MDYQLVPSPKNKQMKAKKEECHYRFNENGANTIYSLQPAFKAPRSTRDGKNGPMSPSDSENGTKQSISNASHNKKYNHFTMARPGLQNNTAVTTELFKTIECLQMKHPSSTENRDKRATTDHCSKAYFATQRRASEGNELKVPKSHCIGRRSVPDVDAPGITLVSPNKISLDTHQNGKDYSGTRTCLSGQQQQGRRRSTGSKSAKEVQIKICDGQDVPRRKSLYEWRQQKLQAERRPVSTERFERRNVISPTTLSRLGMNGTESGENGDGSTPICTENDWKAYSARAPCRRLVSHKELRSCSLPYNDNIGLEEVVTSDEARKAAQLKLASQQRKPCTQQTPKQIWCRTVRSILAANHLYYSIQKRK